MNSAKIRFRQLPQASEWDRMANSIAFEEAADAAMVTLTDRLPPEHGTVFVKGAKEFLGILSSLTKQEEAAKKSTESSLNYNATTKQK